MNQRDEANTQDEVAVERREAHTLDDIPGYSSSPQPGTCQHEEQVELSPGEWATVYCTSTVTEKTIVVQECENNHRTDA